MSLNRFIETQYERVKTLAGHKRAEPILATVSFAESSFFPIPPDVMLIPMVMSRPERAWRYAFVCTLASVLGGALGYFLGLWFWESLGQPVLDALGKGDKMETMRKLYETHGALAVFGAGLTPFPYKVITIMSGALKLNFGLFMAASVLARSMRFFLVAAIVKKFGPRAEDYIRKNFALATIIIFALLLIIYAIWHWGISPMMSG
jgi:membrane protein YqaA with SNARE-associated domain